MSDDCLIERNHTKEEGRPSRWKDGLTRSLMHGSTLSGDSGFCWLRDQPTYDRNGVISHIPRFRHHCLPIL